MFRRMWAGFGLHLLEEEGEGLWLANRKGDLDLDLGWGR